MDSTTTDIRSISAYGPARSSVSGSPLEPQELQRMQRYWNATLYLSAGMIYLRDNPLLREPLKPDHVKRRLLGHWGSDPGQTFIWVHLNRVIRKFGLDMIYISGPGHGAPAVISTRSRRAAGSPPDRCTCSTPSAAASCITRTQVAVSSSPSRGSSASGLEQ